MVVFGFEKESESSRKLLIFADAADGGAARNFVFI